MRGGWETKTLGEVCKFTGGGTPSKKRPEFFCGDIPWATVRDMRHETISKTEFKITEEAVALSSTNVIDAPNVVIATRVGLGKVCLIKRKTAINQDLRAIIPIDAKQLYWRYLFWWLKSIADVIVKNGTGATVQGVKLPFVKALEIPLPPLVEQKRIVGVLDEAFGAIGVAVANAQKNLANARELFETTLNNIFTQKGKGWVEKRLDEVCLKIQDGAHHSPKKFYEHQEKGLYPYLTSKNIRNNYLKLTKLQYVDASFHDTIFPRCNPEFGDVLLTKDGANTGNVTLNTLNEPFSLLSSVCLIKTAPDTLEPNFLKFYIQSRSGFEQITGKMTGAAIKRIVLKTIKASTIPIPSLQEQTILVKKLELLLLQTQRLETIYQQKLHDLAELKQSILQKAFAGELTDKVSVVASVAVDTTAPAFAANIICFAHALHVREQRDKTFGRVKAQKELHLTESIGGVDLGRKPEKDAAGPNDFSHMLRAEDWARQQQFFEFVKREDGRGYDFKKLPRYDEMKTKAFAMLEPYRPQLEKINSLLVNKDTEAAEVFTTVHTAWNNLIIDGAEITDEAICHEARENWHPDKLAIPVSKFKDAIHEIKQKNQIPNGTAKYVGKRQRDMF